ncbi:MAG: bifunctional UDP-N-acetylglucosamine diphosphorylase/glucosamine-1-phosphate N-acetyltransferase GlmU [Actinobacteria bacterium]|nr:bifunctional UDP-N-acetylglucosamine diphosphorylase/glucosamine-1-phosphate N-acetyltransferase GlmU [Actinomycetota bacterium]
MSEQSVIAVVLAAGEGTRMKSTTAKVLHGFAGRSMLGHVLAALEPLAAHSTAVVVGHQREQVTGHLAQIAPTAQAVVQERQLGTGHAVATALAEVAPGDGVVIVVPGDAPLLRPDTVRAVLDEHLRTGAAATLASSVVADPFGYGRVVRGPDDRVVRVVEQKDADLDEQAITEVSALVYAFDEVLLRDAVTRLSTDNAQGEQYLPEVVSIFVAEGRDVRAVVVPADETAGVNDRVQLAAAHRVYNARLLDAHMRAGVTVIDPATTFVDATVTIERDAVLAPNTRLHGACMIDEGATIGPDTTLTDTTVGPRSHVRNAVADRATIGADVTVGPFAYLRPGAVLHDDVHVGTFVEIKASEIGTGTKVPHLSYVGDATIGEHTNIGAATVFVNYDGVDKHRSVIGSHARTGADNMFVAPVEVGDGAYTAAGSIITEDVPAGALAVARAMQRNVEGWVARKRPGTASAEAAHAAAAGSDTSAAADNQQTSSSAEPVIEEQPS